MYLRSEVLLNQKKSYAWLILLDKTLCFQVELNDYSPSGIWDVMDVPGVLIEDRSRIVYQIKIRRLIFLLTGVSVQYIVSFIYYTKYTNQLYYIHVQYI